jgi:hypothetical protein
MAPTSELEFKSQALQLTILLAGILVVIFGRGPGPHVEIQLI